MNVFIASGKGKWCSCYRKQYGSSSKILKLELTCGQAIPLLSIYSKDLKAESLTDLCTPMFVAPLFIKSHKIESTQEPIDR